MFNLNKGGFIMIAISLLWLEFKLFLEIIYSEI
jgi:hypothetical protein|nr:MAG TPA: hypothetical protein [Bacteriophage sp.]DAW48238.1 MAG TPA: hypothetical protein [Caudoviricetes sp.]